MFFALSDNSCTVSLILQSTHYYRKQFLTAVLHACATTLPSRVSIADDPSSSMSMVKWRVLPETDARSARYSAETLQTSPHPNPPLKQSVLILKVWIMDSHSRAPKKNTSHGNEVLPQDTTHLIQRPCYQRGSPCQDPAENRTTRRTPCHGKETQTAVVWLCLPFVRSGQNHLAKHSEREKKIRQTEEEVGRQH